MNILYCGIYNVKDLIYKMVFGINWIKLTSICIITIWNRLACGTIGNWIIGANSGSKSNTNGINIYDSYSINKDDTNGHAYSRIESINKE